MRITKFVYRYYAERNVKRNGVFSEFQKDRKISIHEIINHNGGIISHEEKKFFMARSNDIVLLHMVRKRESLESFMWQLEKDDMHKRRFFNFKKWAKRIAEDRRMR